MEEDDEVVESADDNELFQAPWLTDPEKLKVYAYFGAAAERAQRFEADIRKFAATYDAIRSSVQGLEDLGPFEVALTKRTMGQLVTRIRFLTKMQLPFIEGEFDKAVNNRNLLMHDFFIRRAPQIETPEGRRGLLSELGLIQRQIVGAQLLINHMRSKMLKALKAGSSTTTPS